MIKSIYSTDGKILRAWLKEKRRGAGLTIRELAERLDVHHSIIGKIETGERRLDVVELIEYSNAIEADPIECIVRLLEVRKGI
ncbi:MAG: helix-turn-helix transcriptional regulator [Thiotrichales bacterium]|jgi:transcriptional regulator with XRE-family HTH domain|nr:helix-turn-helix transcriptional regulator [Victivallales bacterium]MBT3613817.1 helix-turn-helix transcriptional regulator [Thiotrichales bacterium]MBT3753257.1 helix-turn-helix transcriptional regulator [Thiotrichales bacterium]MBT3838016.1 helix-turn-helix transcriptional regulator [Thiotrichales bacterium]MBT4152109.1 helix-turn-helix transcriptional regulator [Thiotrichales bacterium]